MLHLIGKMRTNKVCQNIIHAKTKTMRIPKKPFKIGNLPFIIITTISYEKCRKKDKNEKICTKMQFFSFFHEKKSNFP